MKLNVDFSKKLGPVKPMHEVGQPPFHGDNTRWFQTLKDAHVRYCRLHDVGGLYGGNRFVDIPNIFRDFDADENDPASYDFAFTDWLLAEMAKYDLEPIYRLGVTIENYHNVRQYRLEPPKDPAKWARICEHIIRHYNEGWADGFHYGIKYWEIWNEPDNGRDNEENAMWYGTAEQYYELYSVTAKHLKKCFGDTIQVGGFASCGFYDVIDHPELYGMTADAQQTECGDINLTPSRYRYFVIFFEGFFDYILKTGAPIDFFSWHSYANVPGTCMMDDYVAKKLKEYGYEGLFTMCNEWNNAPSRELWCTDEAGAALVAMLMAMQHKTIGMMCYYDARIGNSAYGGLYHPLTQKPTVAYYTLKAFGELYALGTEVALDGCDKDVYAMAAADGTKKAVLITNVSDQEKVIDTGLSGFRCLLADTEHPLSECDKDAGCFVLKRYQTALLVSE